MNAPETELLKHPPVTKEIAHWLSHLRADDVPDNVRAAIRLLVLDTLGAALAGADQPWSRMSAEWAKLGAQHGRQVDSEATAGLATLWGERAPSVRPGDAALANGTMAHAFELDDFHTAKMHPGAVVVPAVLALAEARGLGGERLETAIAAGYEVMIRTALALDPSATRLQGWHITAVTGTLGAAAACSVLIGLDEERTAWALGLAGTQSGGLFAFGADGTMSKRLHPGRAAQSGVMAVELAELGFSGPTQVLETPDGGLLWAFSSKSRTAPLTEGLGRHWHAAETCFKPYSCCGSVHSCIDAALALRPLWQLGARVRVGAAKVVDVQCGYDYTPGSQLNSQMSLRYCIAVAIQDGAALLDQFRETRIADPSVTELAQAIEIVHDPELDGLYPARFAGWVEIETAPGSGQFERKMILDPSGHPANPAREAALRAKYATLATPVLGNAGADDLAAAVDALDQQTARQLVAKLTPNAA